MADASALDAPAAEVPTGETRRVEPTAPAPRAGQAPWRAALLPFLLVLAVFAAYQPVWHAGFVWDDDAYVTENPLLTADDGWTRIWFSTDAPSQYFPLVYSTFRVERALWGLNPLGYHLVNVLLHGLNAVLAGLLLRRLRVPGAWFAAAIFALHPVQVESVAWITELKNVESLLFSLLAAWGWLEFLRARRRVAYIASLVAFQLALFAKTTACTVPVALALMTWLVDGSLDWRRLRQLLPYAGLGFGMGLLTMWWERHHQGTQGEGFAISLVERGLIAGRAVWFYLGKFLWPAALSFSYERWTMRAADLASYVGAAAVLAVATLGWGLRRRLPRGGLAAAVFFVVTLSPVLGFIMLYTFRYSFVADHYQYVALLGLAAIAAAAWSRLPAESRTGKALRVGSVALVLPALGVA
jgi:hypothetical protein